jgi:hypothetical protein
VQLFQVQANGAAVAVGAVSLKGQNFDASSPFVVTDAETGTGDTWLFFVETDNGTPSIVYRRFTQLTGIDSGKFPGVAGNIGQLEARVDDYGNIWVFWNSSSGLYSGGLMSATWNRATNTWGAVRSVGRLLEMIGPLDSGRLGLFSATNPNLLVSSNYTITYRTLFLQL